MNKQTCIIHSLTKEEQELLYFAEPVGYHTRLQQYLEYPQGFASKTTLPKSKVSLSTTKTFRGYLWYNHRTHMPRDNTHCPEYLFFQDLRNRKMQNRLFW